MKVKLNVVLEMDGYMVDAICDDMNKFGASIIIINKHECVVHNVSWKRDIPLDSDFPAVELDATEQEPLLTHKF